MDLDLEQLARESLGASSAFPLGEPNTAFAQYFIGNSYLAPLAGGVANVTFEPSCRNNWHVHHGERQVLVCTGGRGWYQEWGQPAQELHASSLMNGSSPLMTSSTASSPSAKRMYRTVR